MSYLNYFMGMLSEMIDKLISQFANIGLSGWLNIVLSLLMLRLANATYKLNKTMTDITKDDKKEKIGHDLSIVLPTAMYDHKTQKANITNFCIVNHKNKTEVIYRIYIEDNNTQSGFWTALGSPLVISPYNTVFIPKIDDNTNKDIANIKDYKIYAVTNDLTVELKKNIDCFNKPQENKKDTP